jgi:hypothetical protein
VPDRRKSRKEQSKEKKELPKEKIEYAVTALKKIVEQRGLNQTQLEELSSVVLRLAELNLWSVEYSSWLRLTNGGFAIERIVGGKTKDWEWLDPSAIQTAWESGKNSSGHGVLTRFDQKKNRQILPINYDLARHHDPVGVLWGKGIGNSSSEASPLFATHRKKQTTAKAKCGDSFPSASLGSE